VAAPNTPGSVPARWGTWVYTNKKVLRIAAVTLAALALAFWGQPTGKTILVLAGLLLAALALIEFSASHPNAPPRSPPRREPWRNWSRSRDVDHPRRVMLDHPSRGDVRRNAVADGSGDGFLTAGPTVRRSRGGRQDDRGLCWWVHYHSGQGGQHDCDPGPPTLG
jgi:hypothetical protein